MAHNFIKVFLFAVTVFVIYSFTPLDKISIQVAVPPKYQISPEVRSIAVFNRSMNDDFINFRKDSAENLLENIRDRQNYPDSAAADSAVIVAAKAIFESQRFDVVVPLERNIRRFDSNSKLPPLDTATIDQICEDFKVDAVLVLESFSEKISGRFEMPWRRIIGQLDLTYNSSWNFYQPGQKPPVLSLTSHDVLSWTGGLDNSHKEGVPQLPSIKDALITGGILSGLDIVDQICPRWLDKIRYYYTTGDSAIDAAVPLIKLNKWEEAAAIWEKYLSESSISLRSMIEFNLALASEMTGELDEAIDWAAKSLKTKYSRAAELYLKDLDLRRSELERIKM
jgi:hypothetical protein